MDDRQSCIELCQTRLIDGINSFEKIVVNPYDRDLVITTMYANQLWIMQSLNIILENMKD